MMQLATANPYEKYMNEEVAKDKGTGQVEIEMTSHDDKRNYEDDLIQA